MRYAHLAPDHLQDAFALVHSKADMNGLASLQLCLRNAVPATFIQGALHKGLVFDGLRGGICVGGAAHYIVHRLRRYWIRSQSLRPGERQDVQRRIGNA